MLSRWPVKCPFFERPRVMCAWCLSPLESACPIYPTLIFRTAPSLMGASRGAGVSGSIPRSMRSRGASAAVEWEQRRRCHDSGVRRSRTSTGRRAPHRILKLGTPDRLFYRATVHSTIHSLADQKHSLSTPLRSLLRIGDTYNQRKKKGRRA